MFCRSCCYSHRVCIALVIEQLSRTIVLKCVNFQIYIPDNSVKHAVQRTNARLRSIAAVFKQRLVFDFGCCDKVGLDGGCKPMTQIFIFAGRSSNNRIHLK